MKTYTVITDPPAERDILESFEWGCLVWGIPHAHQWAQALRRATNSLSTLPQRHPLAPENDDFAEEVRQMTFHRYRILYTTQADSVHILHVRGAYIGEQTDEE